MRFGISAYRGRMIAVGLGIVGCGLTAALTTDGRARATQEGAAAPPASAAPQETPQEGPSDEPGTKPEPVGLETLPGTGNVAPTRLGAEKEDELPFVLDRDQARLRRLDVDGQVWLDARQKIVVVGTKVALQRGPLEMFACPKGTKEHESVLAVEAPAFVIHAALLAAGAKQGRPVRFEPEYAAATGQEIDIYVVWEHEGKPRWRKAQEWVLDHQTAKPMEHPWVFGGSLFVTDERTGQRHYMAEAGELICVSNFTTATLDLPIESSQSNQALLFEANADAIPAKGTVVTMVLVPKS